MSRLSRIGFVVLLGALTTLAFVGPLGVGGPLDDGILPGLSDADTPTDAGTDHLAGPTPTLPPGTAPDRVSSTATTIPERDGLRNLSNPPVTVAIRNQAAPERDLTVAIRNALAFWNANTRHGAYETRFEFRPNASDPDVIVWYNDTTGCESDHSIGCAPQLDDDPRVRTPIGVQIEYNSTRNRRQDTMTIIHEFGHVLGIGHCVPPKWVMGHAGYCLGEGVSLPDVQDRDFPWRGSTLRLFVEVSGVPESEQSQTRRQIGHAIQYFRDGANGTVPANRSIVVVDDPYAADISIRAGAVCSESNTACFEQWGTDPDSDRVYEYYTNGAVRISADEVETRGWYAGWALSKLLSPGDPPSVFVDATYEEISGKWWELE